MLDPSAKESETPIFMVRKDNLFAGFSVALGVAACLLLLFLIWRFVGAIATMISPFVLALILTLMLDPLADRLESRIPTFWAGGRRLWAVLFIFLGLLLFLAGLVAFIVPNLIAQSTRLITFFAPLTYRIERVRDDGRAVLLKREVTGNQYIIRGLENGKSYRFRVIALDSESKRYALQDAVVKPTNRGVNKELVSRTSKQSQQDIKAAENANDTRTSELPDDYVEDIPTLPTPSDRVTPNINISLFPPIGATPKPTPAQNSEDGSLEEGSALTDDTSTPSGSVNHIEPDVETVSPTPTSETEAAQAALEGTPTPSSEESPVPNTILPGPIADSATPIAPGSVRTTPSLMPSAQPVATASPAPVSTPNPVKTTASPTGLPSPATARPAAKTVSERTVRLPDPGTVLALPSDGQVRLLWRPPVAAASGFDRLRTQADQWLVEHHSIGPLKLPPNLAAIQAQYSAQLSLLVRQVSQRAADIVLGSVSTALTITLALIIGFYMLMDFDRLRMRLFHLIPESARGGVLVTLSDVGVVFGNYIRGMTTVASAYGVVSIIVFFAMGSFFNIGLTGYALLLGVMAGVIYPIPFLGPTLTTLIVAAVSLATGGTPVQAIITAVVVQLQNAVFDNVVTPKVVGQSVGLHPLITIFALLLGGQIFGLAGMLLAVPVAASIQRLLIRLYPHLGEPTSMVQHPLHREKRRTEAAEQSRAMPDETETPPEKPDTTAPSPASKESPYAIPEDKD